MCPHGSWQLKRIPLGTTVYSDADDGTVNVIADANDNAAADAAAVAAADEIDDAVASVAVAVVALGALNAVGDNCLMCWCQLCWECRATWVSWVSSVMWSLRSLAPAISIAVAAAATHQKPLTD